MLEALMLDLLSILFPASNAVCTLFMRTVLALLLFNLHRVFCHSQAVDALRVSAMTAMTLLDLLLRKRL